MPSSSQNPDPLSHPFSDLASDINFCFQTWPGRNDDCHKIRTPTKRILDLKMHITRSFLSIWNNSDLIKHRRRNGTTTPTGGEILPREPSEHA